MLYGSSNFGYTWLIEGKMFFLGGEHNPPHIHITYSDYVGVIDIQTVKMMEGDLPPRALNLATEWVTQHQKELLEMWNTQVYKKLPPLDIEGNGMFYKVISVKPIEDYALLVRFENGETKKYDTAALFDRIEAFKPLTYIDGLFGMVQVDTGGYGVSWNSEIDLSCNELYENGMTVSG